MNKAGIGITLFLVAGLGAVVANNMLQNPAPTPDHSMEPPDTSDIASGDPIVDVVLPEELSQLAQIGQRVFETACAACHGLNAAGQNGVAPPLIHDTYRPGHHSDGAFVYAAQNGVQAHHWDFGNMPPIQGVTDGDVLAVARYIRELQRVNGIF